jgi:hypothetical protein
LNNELERLWKEVVKVKFEDTILASAVGLREYMKNLSQNRQHWSLSRDLNPGCTEYKSELVHTRPGSSIPKSTKIKVTIYLHRETDTVCMYILQAKEKTGIFFNFLGRQMTMILHPTCQEFDLSHLDPTGSLCSS